MIMVIFFMANQIINESLNQKIKVNYLYETGFDLMTCDSYFTILVVFTNKILAENTYFTHHIERAEHKIMS